MAAKDKDPAEGQPAGKPAKAPEVDSTDSEPAPAVVVDPYPDYDTMELSELRSEAEAKGVGVPADVEKALLVAHLRKVAGEGEDVPSEAERSFDLMTVDELRSLAPDSSKALTPAEERGYLVGQLRAVASGPSAAQSAQVGSARPSESLPAPSGVTDKDQGRG